jgi:hypothetical protein
MTPRVRMLLLVGVELVAAFVFVTGYAIAFQHLDLRRQLLSYSLVAHDTPNPGEVQLFILGIALGVPALLLFCDAGLRLVEPQERDLVARVEDRAALVGWIAAAFAMCAALLVRAFVYQHSELTDDERVYIFEARALLHGSLAAPQPGPLAIFAHQFVVECPGGLWAGVYPPGQPALIAIGLPIGAPWLAQMLLTGGIVKAATRLAQDLWGARVAVVAALLLATSPALIFTAATLHNVVPATFLLLVTVLAARAARAGSTAAWALVGASVGFALLVRPLEAAFAALAAVALLLPALVERGKALRAWARLGLALVVGLPFVGLQLLANQVVTGSPLLSPYTVFARNWPGAAVFGFGPAGFGALATFEGAVVKTVAVLARLGAWVFGWPLSLVPFLIGATGLLKDAGVRAISAFVLLHFVAYFFVRIGAVHDVGSFYHFFDLPLIVLVSSCVLVRVADVLSPLGARARALPLRLAGAGAIVSLLTFVPAELGRLTYVTSLIRAPILEAQRVAAGRKVLVFWERMQPPGEWSSWVYWPPPPGPALDDPVLWVRHGPSDALVAAKLSDRAPYFLSFDDEGAPNLVPLR